MTYVMFAAFMLAIVAIPMIAYYYTVPKEEKTVEYPRVSSDDDKDKFRSQVNSRDIVEMAKQDAKNNTMYVFSAVTENTEKYMKAYRDERKRIVERKAVKDAALSHNFDKGLMSFQPVMTGAELTDPYEVKIYQEKFIVERAKLHEEWAEVAEILNETVIEEVPHMDMKTFYQQFNN